MTQGIGDCVEGAPRGGAVVGEEGRLSHLSLNLKMEWQLEEQGEAEGIPH